MDRLTQGIRHYTNSAIDFVGLIFPLNSSQLIWGLSAFALLMPVMAHAWWQQNTVAIGGAAADQNSSDALQYVKETNPVDSGYMLNADTNASGSPDSTNDGAQAEQNNHADVRVHINDQPVQVPSDGTIHKEITSQNGKATVDISVDSDTSGASNSESHTTLNIETHSTTKSEGIDVD